MLASDVEKHAPVRKYFSEKGPLNFSKNPGMTVSAKTLTQARQAAYYAY